MNKMKNSPKPLLLKILPETFRLLLCLILLLSVVNMFLFFVPQKTTITLASPQHTPLSDFFDPAELTKLIISADNGKHDEQNLSKLSEEIAKNISIRTGFDDYIVIVLSSFNSDAFALSEGDFSRIAVFLAQNYALQYSQSLAETLFIRIPYSLKESADADFYLKLSTLKNDIYSSIQHFSVNTTDTSPDKTSTEDFNAYFSDLCGRISPSVNAKIKYICDNLLSLYEELTQFEKFIRENEDYLLFYEEQAVQNLQTLFEQFSAVIKNYNFEVMQTAKNIYSKYIYIQRVMQSSSLSPWAEILSAAGISLFAASAFCSAQRLAALRASSQGTNPPSLFGSDRHSPCRK